MRIEFEQTAVDIEEPVRASILRRVRLILSMDAHWIRKVSLRLGRHRPVGGDPRTYALAKVEFIDGGHLVMERENGPLPLLAQRLLESLPKVVRRESLRRFEWKETDLFVKPV